MTRATVFLAKAASNDRLICREGIEVGRVKWMKTKTRVARGHKKSSSNKGKV